MPLWVKHVRENKTGRLDYRRIIPPALRPFWPGGKTNFVRSLGGKGSPGVLTRYDEAAAEYAACEARAAKQQAGAYDTLDSPTIAYLAEAYRQEVLAGDEVARWSPDKLTLFNSTAADLKARGVAYVTPWASQEARRWSGKTRETLDLLLPEYRRMRAEGDVEAIGDVWREEALAIAEAQGLLIDPLGREAIGRLCRALNDAAISAGEDQLRRLAGEDVPTPLMPERPSGKRPEPPAQVRASVPLMATFEAYAKEQAISAGVRYEWGRYHQKLIAFLGHDDLARLTVDDVIRWKNHLVAEPTDRGKPRSAVTVNGKYLMSLKATLKWAVDQRTLKENVATGVRARVPKAIKLRERHFTADEVTRILSASLVPAPAKMAPEGRLARRWVPWLCAYTGARAGEIAQLRGQDVQEIEGIWTLRITPEAGTVKSREARVVPIHEHLIAQDFLSVAKAAGDGPIFYDPARRRADGEDNRHVKKVAERLAAWVRKDVGITDKGVAPNHGWRHTFKSRALEAGIPEITTDAITGHVPATVGRKYAVPTLRAKSDAIALYPRYDVTV